MDDRNIMRFAPGYAPIDIQPSLDWSDWDGFNRAIEMCNNNGACRKVNVGTMCPSYRVTKNEQHLTRGRANTLRLAITGQLGPDAFTSDAMYQTMDLCVGCKGCKRECPTGIDMAKMKIEFLNHYHQKHGLTLRDRVFAYLPRYAPKLKYFSFILNLRDQIPFFAKVSEWLLGVSSKRKLPRWRADHFNQNIQESSSLENKPEVVLLVDTFNSCFEVENANAALEVLNAAGYKVTCPSPVDKGRPLCCGRTFFSNGLLDEARVEANRVIETLLPYVTRGVPIVGLEPSCLLTLRDEYLALLPGEESRVLSDNAFLFEEFLVKEKESGKLNLELKPIEKKQALLHGHCHQKAFAAMSSVQQVLSLIPELKVTTIDSGCCGMAGSFGYENEHFDASMQMAELSLFPTIKADSGESIIVADGTSCRSQIQHGTGRDALHVARVLQMALTI